jgi:hypothetical protein
VCLNSEKLIAIILEQDYIHFITQIEHETNYRYEYGFKCYVENKYLKQLYEIITDKWGNTNIDVDKELKILRGIIK